VTDLAPSDFVLYEDGVRQEIRAFATRQVTADPSLAGLPLLRRDGPSIDVTPQNRRIILIVIGHAPAQPAIAAMSEFVRRSLPQDQIAVAAWNRATPFTSAHERLAQLLDRLAGEHDRIDAEIAAALASHGRGIYEDEPPLPDAVQRNIDRVLGDVATPVSDAHVSFTASISVVGGLSPAEYSSGNATNLDLLTARAAVSYLRGIDGEKHLVFIAPPADPVAVIDPHSLADEANDARVAVHFFGGDSHARPPVSAAPRSIGLALDRPDLLNVALGTAGGAGRGQESQRAAMIDNASRFVYVLGYSPTHPAPNDKFRKIVVRLNLGNNSPAIKKLLVRPEGEHDVRWRAGYFPGSSPPPLDATQVRTYKRIAAAAVADKPIDDIKLKVRANAGPHDVTISLQVDIGLPASETQGEQPMALTVFAYTTDLHGLFLPDGLTESLSLPVARGAPRTPSGAPVSLQMPLRLQPPGVMSAKHCKVIVYDAASDRVGSQIVTLTPRAR